MSCPFPVTYCTQWNICLNNLLFQSGYFEAWGTKLSNDAPPFNFANFLLFRASSTYQNSKKAKVAYYTPLEELTVQLS